MKAEIELNEHKFSGQLTVDREFEPGATAIYTWDFTSESYPHEGVSISGPFGGHSSEIGALASAEEHGVRVTE